MMEVGLLAAAVLRPPEPSRTPASRVEGLPGLENVGLIAPGLYRGSAPEGEGFDTLKRIGIRTVVNLRHYHGASEEKECRRRGLAYEHVVLESSDAPRDEEVRRFLALVTDPARRPLYFHCWRGKDRTGALCAAYRLAVLGWSLEEAQQEMKAYGFFPGWRDLWDWVTAFSRDTERFWPGPPPPP